MNTPFAPNTLYYGDCLDIMSGFPEGYIDLICLDPPFNSNEKYNKVFKDSGLRIDPQIKAFDDVWLWDNTSAERVARVKNAVARLFQLHDYTRCPNFRKKHAPMRRILYPILRPNVYYSPRMFHLHQARKFKNEKRKEG